MRVAADLTVIDIRPPGVDGLQVFHDLRTLSPDLPAIVITGYPSFPGWRPV
jgi:YesN/AraC family two-component response regulator